MWLRSWLEPMTPRPANRRAERGRLTLEALDERTLPSFLAPVGHSVGSNPSAIVVADFDGDGKKDLAVTNPGDGTVSVLLGKGDGTFKSAVNSDTGYSPLSVAVGDFDGDGKLDLVTANVSDVSVLLGKGDGTFAAPQSIDLGTEPRSVAVGDFNADGKMDLAVTSNFSVFDGYYYGYYGGYYPIYHTEGAANVLIGNGDGTFSGPNTTALGYGYHLGAVVADFDGDGTDDFATINSDYGAVDVLLNDGGGLQAPGEYSAGYALVGLAVGDVNGAGGKDLVTANSYGATVGVLLNDGSGGFGAVKTYAAGSYPYGVALGDVNKDGNLDVVAADYSASAVNVLLGRGDGTFAQALKSDAGSGPVAVATGDFDGDGWLDAATADAGGNTASVLLNDHTWPRADAPKVSVNDATVTEGNTGTVNLTFTITLSAAYGHAVTVHYATADGTATDGSDYTGVSGDITFAPNETSKTVTVAVKGDRVAEGNETFALNLTTTDAFIGDGQGVGTIKDDEPSISINDVSKQEGNGGGKTAATLFVFTISLSGTYDQAVTVKYATANGSGTVADNDYVATSGTVTFAPGETTKTITVVVKPDKKRESNETFFVNLSGASSNALIDDPQGVGTILNDDNTGKKH